MSTFAWTSNGPRPNSSTNHSYGSSSHAYPSTGYTLLPAGTIPAPPARPQVTYSPVSTRPDWFYDPTGVGIDPRIRTPTPAHVYASPPPRYQATYPPGFIEVARSRSTPPSTYYPPPSTNMTSATPPPRYSARAPASDYIHPPPTYQPPTELRTLGRTYGWRDAYDDRDPYMVVGSVSSTGRSVHRPGSGGNWGGDAAAPAWQPDGSVTPEDSYSNVPRDGWEWERRRRMESEVRRVGGSHSTSRSGYAEVTRRR